jgi:hypothetical protein
MTITARVQLEEISLVVSLKKPGAKTNWFAVRRQSQSNFYFDFDFDFEFDFDFDFAWGV